MKEELLKLAERVEALSGPDREVDARSLKNPSSQSARASVS